MSGPDGPAPDGATVAAYDIARLAGVGRAAVSNWRRRHGDFPKPVAGTTASPLYALSDVEEWLTRHGRAFQVSAGDRVWQRVRGTAEDLRLGELIGCLGAFLVFHRRQPRRWRTLARQPDGAVAGTLNAAVATAVPELPGELPERLDAAWVGVLREAADAAGERRHREVFDLLYDRYLEIHSRRRVATPEPVAELMVELAGATGGTVLDPACGLGTLLLAAGEQGAAALLGQELDGTAARVAAVRLLLRDAPVRIHAGDSLRRDAFAGEPADAVVCNPPFHERSWGYDELSSDPRWEYGLPPRGEPELAWVQHCLGHARPGRRVAVAVPAAVAVRRAGRRIRSNLLRSGALRAVIRLPDGGADVWVLRRPAAGDPPPTHVLVADATGDPAAASQASQAWQAFRADPEQPLPAAARAVRLLDLLDDEVDVSPARHLARPDTGAGLRFADARAAVRAAVDRLAAVPELAGREPLEPGTVPETTVGDLVRAGVVTVHQAPLKLATGAGEVLVLTTKDVREHRVPSGRTAASAGAVAVRAGDVIAALVSRQPAVLVVTEDIAATGAVLGPRLYLLRPDPDHLDPDFLAGFVRVAASSRAGGAAAHRAGSGGTRSDLHRITLPRLPLAGQRRYGRAFRELARFSDDVARTALLADAFVQQGLAGLAAGRLRPPEAAG